MPIPTRSGASFVSVGMRRDATTVVWNAFADARVDRLRGNMNALGHADDVAKCTLAIGTTGDRGRGRLRMTRGHDCAGAASRSAACRSPGALRKSMTTPDRYATKQHGAMQAAPSVSRRSHAAASSSPVQRVKRASGNAHRDAPPKRILTDASSPGRRADRGRARGVAAKPRRS